MTRAPEIVSPWTSFCLLITATGRPLMIEIASSESRGSLGPAVGTLATGGVWTDSAAFVTGGGGDGTRAGTRSIAGILTGTAAGGAFSMAAGGGLSAAGAPVLPTAVRPTTGAGAFSMAVAVTLPTAGAGDFGLTTSIPSAAVPVTGGTLGRTTGGGADGAAGATACGPGSRWVSSATGGGAPFGSST